MAEIFIFVHPCIATQDADPFLSAFCAALKAKYPDRNFQLITYDFAGTGAPRLASEHMAELRAALKEGDNSLYSRAIGQYEKVGQYFPQATLETPMSSTDFVNDLSSTDFISDLLNPCHCSFLERDYKTSRLLFSKFEPPADAELDTHYLLLIHPGQLGLLNCLMADARWLVHREHFHFFCSNPDSWDLCTAGAGMPKSEDFQIPSVLDVLIRIETPERSHEALQQTTPLKKLSEKGVAALRALDVLGGADLYQYYALFRPAFRQRLQQQALMSFNAAPAWNFPSQEPASATDELSKWLRLLPVIFQMKPLVIKLFDVVKELAQDVVFDQVMRELARRYSSANPAFDVLAYWDETKTLIKQHAELLDSVLPMLDLLGDLAKTGVAQDSNAATSAADSGEEPSASASAQAAVEVGQYELPFLFEDLAVFAPLLPWINKVIPICIEFATHPAVRAMAGGADFDMFTPENQTRLLNISKHATQIEEWLRLMNVVPFDQSRKLHPVGFFTGLDIAESVDAKRLLELSKQLLPFFCPKELLVPFRNTARVAETTL